MYAEQASGSKPMQNVYFFKRQKYRSPFSLNTNRFGGAERDRTADPLLAKQVLSQLSYSPSSSITSRTKPQGSATIHIACHSIIPNPHSHMQMVGPGRLELPTPRLSSVCSNQLSYGPIRETGRRGFVFLKKEKRGRRGSPYHPNAKSISVAYYVSIVT